MSERVFNNVQAESGRKRLKVLLVAYACEPESGSEPGTGWNTALSLAQLHDVTVLTRANNQEKIENALSGMPPECRPSFFYIDPSPWVLWLKAKGFLTIQMFYFAWHLALYSSKDLHSKNFDIVHQLTFNSFEVPPFLFKRMNGKKVWGPVGGGQVTVKELLPAFTRAGARREMMRNWRVELSTSNPLVSNALSYCDLVLFANKETEHRLASYCEAKRAHMMDVGVNVQSFCPVKSGNPSEFFTFLFAGRLEDRKGVMLLMDAFSQVISRHSHVRLQIVGCGPLLESMKSKAKEYNLEEMVHFVGAVSHDEMRKQYEDADAFVFPSLRDTSGTVVLEAMAMGLPIVCFDHQGAALMVDDHCGIRVPIQSYEKTVEDFSDALCRLVNDQEICLSMGVHARERVSSLYDWNVRAAILDQQYQSLLS